ncbi:MAG: hypothetical protein ACRCU6_08130 [Fusobacteriaceae bacterium]
MDYNKNYQLEMRVSDRVSICPSDYFTEEEWLDMEEEDQISFLKTEAWEELEQNITVSILED